MKYSLFDNNQIGQQSAISNRLMTHHYSINPLQSFFNSSSNFHKEPEQYMKNKCDYLNKSVIIETKKVKQIMISEMEYNSLIKNYEVKLSNCQFQFRKSKEHLENSLKNVYKQKIMLLNVINNDKNLIQNYKKKIGHLKDYGLEDFEKISLMLEGSIRDGICVACHNRIKNLELNGSQCKQNRISEENNESMYKTPVKSVRNPETSAQKLHFQSELKRLQGINKQLEAKAVDIKLENKQLQQKLQETRKEINQLRIMKIKFEELNRKFIDQQIQIRNAKKIEEQIKPSDQYNFTKRTISQYVAPLNSQLQNANDQLNFKLKEKSEKIKKLEFTQNQKEQINEEQQKLIDEVNEDIIKRKLESLNSKYKNKYS